MLLATPAAGALSDPFSLRAGAYLVLVDGVGQWGKHVEKRLPPASLTKVMTALIVLEQGNPRDIATVAADSVHETGAKLGIRAGEQYFVHDLLAAALIQSSNDACHALMDHVAGDEKRFVSLMNRRAGDWGLANTHFANGCGHDDDNHYSTAADLAKLAVRALETPAIAGMASMTALAIKEVRGRRHFQIKNSNELIGRYPGALGLKTGFTRKAGKCLIAYAERNGRKVLLVLLNSPGRWWDASNILDIAFAHER